MDYGTLALSRRDGQTVEIETGEGLVTITLYEPQQGRAKLIIRAPKCLNIKRGELQDNRK